MKLPPEQAKEFNKLNFPVVKTTVGCILIKDNKILLTKRNIPPEKDKWCIPGGHIDIGETAIDAIKREVKEETNLEIENLKFWCYWDEFMPKIMNHSLVLIFQGNPKGEEKINNESSEYGWFNYEEISNLDLAFKYRDIFAKYFNNKK